MAGRQFGLFMVAMATQRPFRPQRAFFCHGHAEDFLYVVWGHLFNGLVSLVYHR
jgi:hypothetical protein